MQILRHDKETESGPAPADSPFVCALCSGATQTSFVAQLRRDMPLDIGIVYWVCLASPRTSFYLPFHFGIADFPAGYRLSVAAADSAGVRPQGAGAVRSSNPQEAFWTFSNFRDKMDRKRPLGDGASESRAAAGRAGRRRDARSRLKRRLVDCTRTTLRRHAAPGELLEGVYVSCMEAMGYGVVGGMMMMYLGKVTSCS